MGTLVYTTGEKTLVVGCTDDMTIILPSLSSQMRAVGESFDYKVGLPTLDR
jgi:hypothetical protein